MAIILRAQSADLADSPELWSGKVVRYRTMSMLVETSIENLIEEIEETSTI